MALGADGYAPLGYELCRRCGAPFVEGTRRTGRCQSCDETVAKANATTVVISINGDDAERGPAKTRRRKRRRTLSAEAKARRRIWNRARSRALGDLADRHRDEYQALLEHHHRSLTSESDVG